MVAMGGREVLVGRERVVLVLGVRMGIGMGRGGARAVRGDEEVLRGGGEGALGLNGRGGYGFARGGGGGGGELRRGGSGGYGFARGEGGGCGELWRAAAGSREVEVVEGEGGVGVELRRAGRSINSHAGAGVLSCWG